MEIPSPDPADPWQLPLELRLNLRDLLGRLRVDPDSDKGANHGYRRTVLNQ